jgi:hypothetical protein
MTIVPKSVLAEHATAIRQLGKRVVADVIEIGCRLADCRDNHLEHGQWLPWLKKEFGWTDRTARNFINVYEQSKLEKFSDLNLPVSSLYLLCAPSTPEEHRKIILKRAGAGEEIKRAEIKRGIEAAKAAKPAKRAAAAATRRNPAANRSIRLPSVRFLFDRIPRPRTRSRAHPPADRSITARPRLFGA